MRVEAVDLVHDGHGREGGVVGAGEQVPRRRELAPLRYPEGQGVEHDDLGLVIAGQAGLVNDGFEVGIVAVRRGGEQRPGQQGAVPAASGAVPVVALVQESPRGVTLPSRPHDPGEVDTCGRGHAGVAAPDGRLDREGQGLFGGLKLAGLMPDPAEAGQVVGGLAEKAQALGRRGGMLEIAAGIVEPVGGLGDPAQYRLGVDQAPGVADRREQADSLVGRCGGGRDLAEHHRPGRTEQQAGGAFPGQAALPRRVRALEGQLGGVVRAGLLEPQEGQVPLRVGPQLIVIQRDRFAERAVEMVLGSRDVARGGFQPSGQQQGRHAIAWPGSEEMLGGFERGTDAVRPGDPVSQHDPCPAETVGDPDPQQRVVAGAPGEGGVDVGPLVVDEGQPPWLRRAADRGGRVLRRAAEPVRVRGESVIGRTRLAQPAGREGPDGIEQVVARGTGGRDGERDKRPVG